jgi:predicted RNase H-like HicB family nuclease
MTKVSAFYNGCVTREFTAVIEKKGRWYVAWVEEIPGVNTQGKTLTEARRNLKDALRLVLEENRRLSANPSADSRREVVSVEL